MDGGPGVPLGSNPGVRGASRTLWRCTKLSPVKEASVAEKFQSHACLPTLLDAFAHGTGDSLRTYLVYEQIGQDLRQTFKRLPLQAAQIRNVVTDVLEALGVVHAAGLIHTDVKPSNIFVREQGGGCLRCVLGDLGAVVEAPHRALGMNTRSRAIQRPQPGPL